MENQTRNKKVQIDWMITIVPLTIVIALCILFFFLARAIKYCFR